MRLFSIGSLTAALAFSAIAAAPAWADKINADWLNYSSTLLSPGNGGLTSGTGSIQLNGFANGTPNAVIDILALKTTAGTGTSPESFNSPFSVKLTLSDTQGGSASTTLSGTISGTLGSSTSPLTANYTSPSQTLSLDGNTYNVVPNTDPLLLTTAGGQQYLTAFITATAPPGGDPVPPSTGGTTGTGPTSANNPEPTSLLLGALGWSLLGAGSWWKRNRRPILPRA